MHSLSVDAEADIVQEYSAADQTVVDLDFLPVYECLQRTYRVIPVQAHVQCEMVPGADWDSEEGNSGSMATAATRPKEPSPPAIPNASAPWVTAW